MQIQTISPRRAIDNAFLQESITKTEFETFRQRLLKLFQQGYNNKPPGRDEDISIDNEELPISLYSSMLFL